MDVGAYSLAAQAEEEHWWYCGRRAVLKSVLDHYAPRTCQSLNVLEVGCGNGGNLPLFSTYGKVYAVEMDDLARARASSRGIAGVEKGSLPDSIPFEGGRFDLVTALDVIEHVEDDRKAMLALRRLLAPGGLLVITAPAYMWLWSQHDEFGHHKRRYTKAQLISLMKDQGLIVHYSTYFNTLLFPIAAIRIKLCKLIKKHPSSAMRTPSALVNRLLRVVFFCESIAIPRVSLPCGLSILICASPREQN